MKSQLKPSLVVESHIGGAATSDDQAMLVASGSGWFETKQSTKLFSVVLQDMGGETVRKGMPNHHHHVHMSRGLSGV